MNKKIAKGSFNVDDKGNIHNPVIDTSGADPIEAEIATQAVESILRIPEGKLSNTRDAGPKSFGFNWEGRHKNASRWQPSGKAWNKRPTDD